MPRVIVIGAGSIGERHARCLIATGRAEVAICEPNDATRDRIADAYSFVGAYPSIDTALAESWDAAVVATPAHTHIPIATQLAQAGIHVLIEKPLSTSMDGVAALQDIIQNRNLVAAVGYNHRAHPAARAMHEAIASGRFGKPVEMRLLTCQSFAKYRPAYRDIYFANRAQGGGAIQDAMTHLLNFGEWIAGPIDRIAVDAAHQLLDGVEVEDTVHGIARHGSVLANYVVNMYQHPNEFIVTVACERATVRYELHNQRWRWMDEADGEWHDEPNPLPDRDAGYVRQANAFLDAIAGAGTPLCTLDEGVQTLAATLAALSAADTTQWQQVAVHGSKAHA